MAKTYDELTITDDFMFCKVMKHNVELTKELIERILQTRIEIIEQVESQLPIELTPDGKGIRLDVRMEGDDTIYELEMQNAHKEELPKRSRYYQALTALDMMERGAKYNQLKDSVLIFICTFDPFNAGLARYTVKQTIEESSEVEYNDGTRTIFLSTLEDSHGQEKIDKELKSVFDYFNGRNPESEFAKKIEAAVARAKQQKEWRKEYMLLEEVIDERVEEKLEEAVERGVKIGEARGIEIGDAIRLVSMVDAVTKNSGKDLDYALSLCGVSKEDYLAARKQVNQDNLDDKNT